MLKERNLLEENLIQVLDQVKTKKKVVNQIKDELIQKYGILEGDALGWIDFSEDEVPKLDSRELFLLTEATYKATGTHAIFPREYFTEHEQKESYQYDASVGRNESKSFPITFPNAMVMGNRKYLVLMSTKQIKELLNNNLLYYNFDTQREASFSRKNDKVIMEPTVNRKNIEEMTQLLLDNKLESTNLIFNAAPRTSKSGNELVYNSKTLELTITEGSRLDNVDGYHRSMAIANALSINPDIELMFPVIICNYPTRKAQQFLHQISKATPISKVRTMELNQNNSSSSVIQQLKDESDLKISQTHQLHTLNDEMVTYNVLRDQIEEEFGSKMKTSADELDVADFLVDYFNIIIGSYADEFINNPMESRKTSIINSSNIIGYGLLTLARKLFENDMKPKEVRKILKNIDFNKNNPLWAELDILDSEGNFNTNTNKVRKNIKKYFNEIDIS